MAESEPELDINSIVEETIECVTVRPDGDGWVGDAPDWFGERLFGGFVVSQSVHAVTRTAPDGDASTRCTDTSCDRSSRGSRSRTGWRRSGKGARS